MNIKIVQILCGNNYMFNQERLIFGCHKSLHSFNNSYIDEYWLLPMYTHAKSYIETHSKKPVRIMPYVWNTTFVDLWIKNLAIAEMNAYFYQTIVKMSETYKRATNDLDLSELLRNFAEKFADQVEKKPKTS